MTTQNRYYTNLAQGTFLANVGGLSSSSVSMLAVAAVSWPLSFPFVASIEPETVNEELVLVTSGAGTGASPYIITRGYDGTPAVAHPANAPVIPKVCQLDLAEPQQHLNLTGSASGAHGLPSSAWLGGQYQLIHYEQLATAQSTYTGFNSTVFASIPAGLHHLKVYISARSSYVTADPEVLYAQYNGQTGSVYSDSYVYWAGAGATTPGVQHVSAATAVAGLLWTSAAGPTGVGRSEIYFPFYNDNSGWAKGHSFQCTAGDGTGQVSATGGGACSLVTAPITSLTFLPEHAGSTFLANSLFALYAF